jgi:transcriptional regulator with XRE-family HTH domain
MTTPGSAVATAAPATSIDPRTARRLVASDKVRAFARTVALDIVDTIKSPARALLGWSQAELANASKVATKTIADFEREGRTPYERTLNDIRNALSQAGIEFTNGGQPGVRMKLWQPGDRVRLRGPAEGFAQRSKLRRKKSP